MSSTRYSYLYIGINRLTHRKWIWQRRALSLSLFVLVLTWGAAAAQRSDQRTSVDGAQPYFQSAVTTEDISRSKVVVTPPGTGISPALQGVNTPFEQRRFKLSLSENDVFFSDRGLSQYLEVLYTSPLKDTLVLNTALKFEMVTPAQARYLSSEGESLCCVSPGIYHYPLYLESQLVSLTPLTERLNVRLAGHLRAGVDAPEAIGGPLQNAWHNLIGVANFDAVGEAAYYGGLGGSVLLEGRAGAFSYFAGPSLNVTTLQRSAGVTLGAGLEAAPLTLQAFVAAERAESRYFSEDFEAGRRAMVGLSAALELGGDLGGWTPVLGFSVLYDYNSVAPDLSNLRYTFIPDIQLSIPVK